MCRFSHTMTREHVSDHIVLSLTCIKDVIVPCLQNLMVEQDALIFLIHHSKMMT
jgi:hypothetical protein